MARICREPACWRCHHLHPKPSWGHNAGRALALKRDFTQHAKIGGHYNRGPARTVGASLIVAAHTFASATAKHNAHEKAHVRGLRDLENSSVRRPYNVPNISQWGEPTRQGGLPCWRGVLRVMTAATCVALAACIFVNSQVLCLRLTPSLDTGHSLPGAVHTTCTSKSFFSALA